MAKRPTQTRNKSSQKQEKSNHEFSEKKHFSYWSKDVRLQPKHKKSLLYLCLGLTFLMAILSVRVGLNGDDDVQARYSSDLGSFYQSFGRDTTCFSSGPEIKYYGALFELVTGVTNDVFGYDRNEPNYFKVRHVWNAIFGGIAFYFTALIIGQVAGFEASLLGILLLFFSMRFLGHSLLNPKDIPFAAGYTVGIYYLLEILRQLPKVKRGTLFGMAAGIMISIGIRIGGVLTIAYLGFFLALYFIWQHGLKAVLGGDIKPYLRAFFMPSLLGLAGGLLVWPYGLSNPLQNIPAALDAFANFKYAIKVLFDDEQVWSSEIPVRYLLTWLVVTLPLYTLVGLVIFLGFSRGIFKRYNFIPIVICFFAFAFPIIYVLASQSILYDGWRHFLFTYPPLVVLITLAWQFIMDRYKKRKILHYAVWTVLGLTAIDSVIFLMRNPSFPYVYFNPLVGGTEGAYGSYELDYWGTSVKQAVEAMEKDGILYEGMSDTVTIGSNFSHAVSVYTRKYDGLVKVNYVRWRQRNDRPWEYGIFVNRFVDGNYLKNGYWPTSKTVLSVDVNGVPLAIVEKDSEVSDAYLSTQAINRQDWEAAIQYSEREIEKHPDNEMVWINLGMALLNIDKVDEAKMPLERAISIVPDNQNALNFMGYYHFLKKDFGAAHAIFTKAITLHQTDVTAYYYLARIAYEQQNYTQALEYAKTGIDYNTRNPICYQIASEAYFALGDQVNAQRYQEAFNRLVGR